MTAQTPQISHNCKYCKFDKVWFITDQPLLHEEDPTLGGNNRSLKTVETMEAEGLAVRK